ncbi:MAG: stage II sporulation protein R [Tissierellales bacterium]
MKNRKLIFSLALIISFIYMVSFHSNSQEAYMNLKDGIIRLHVKANSDTEEDQALKLKVRDRILKETAPLLEKSESIEETRAIVKENLDNIKSIAEDVIKEEGKDYKVEVNFGMTSFPTRKYGEMVLPAGEYEALLVTIGEGKGKNWWCVMFPPLCFVEMTHGVAANTEESLDIVTDDKDEDLDSVPVNANVDEDLNIFQDNRPPLILKSKILELLERTKIYIASRFILHN